ncbi:MAG: hypothetical protein Q7S19_03665 [bacterium]|nr:hypothetical protein [bacterium]
MDKIEVTKDIGIVSYNGAHHSPVFKAVLLKTERLVSAVHLVTSLMDTKEKVRDELRSAAVNSMSDLYAVSDKILDRIPYIISLLEVGLTGGLLSQMNYSILKDEYTKLKTILPTLQLVNNIDTPVLPDGFFGEELSTPKKPLNYLKDIGKRTQSHKTDLSTKSSRLDLIVKVIKDSSEYTIKDIISGVSLIDPNVGCSDKTIQRDLIYLVGNGTLIKRGERRWSRYSKKSII